MAGKRTRGRQTSETVNFGADDLLTRSACSLHVCVVKAPRSNLTSLGGLMADLGSLCDAAIRLRRCLYRLSPCRECRPTLIIGKRMCLVWKKQDDKAEDKGSSAPALQDTFAALSFPFTIRVHGVVHSTPLTICDDAEVLSQDLARRHCLSGGHEKRLAERMRKQQLGAARMLVRRLDEHARTTMSIWAVAQSDVLGMGDEAGLVDVDAGGEATEPVSPRQNENTCSESQRPDEAAEMMMTRLESEAFTARDRIATLQADLRIALGREKQLEEELIQKDKEAATRIQNTLELQDRLRVVEDRLRKIQEDGEETMTQAHSECVQESTASADQACLPRYMVVEKHPASGAASSTQTGLLAAQSLQQLHLQSGLDRSFAVPPPPPSPPPPSSPPLPLQRRSSLDRGHHEVAKNAQGDGRQGGSASVPMIRQGCGALATRPLRNEYTVVSTPPQPPHSLQAENGPFLGGGENHKDNVRGLTNTGLTPRLDESLKCGQAEHATRHVKGVVDTSRRRRRQSDDRYEPSAEITANLKGLFIVYCGSERFRGGLHLSLTNFHRLCKDAGIVGAHVKKGDVDVAFRMYTSNKAGAQHISGSSHKRNAHPNARETLLSFAHFVEALKYLGLKQYGDLVDEHVGRLSSINSAQGRAAGDAALEVLIQDTLLPLARRKEQEEAATHGLLDFGGDLCTPETAHVLERQNKLLRSLFGSYCTTAQSGEGCTSPPASTRGLRFEDLQALLTDLNVVPKLVSIGSAFRAFAQITHRDLLRGYALSPDGSKREPARDEVITFVQFLELLIRIAHQSFGGVGGYSTTDRVEALLAWLDLDDARAASRARRRRASSSPVTVPSQLPFR